MSTNEEWRGIRFRGLEKHYSISSLGRVRSDVTRRGTVAGTIKSNCPGPLGYVFVALSLLGQNHRVGVHQLVAQEFIANPENKRCVNHKNGNRGDNRLENLEWMTHKENTQHAMDSLGWTAKRERGQNHHKAKLTDVAVLSIRARAAAGEMLKDLAVEFGVHPSTLSSIVSRRIWTHI